MEHPSREVYEIAKTALENLQLAEEKAPNGGLSAHVEVATMIFRAATYGYRSGLFGLGPFGRFEVMMSSAPTWDHHGIRANIASGVGYLMPSYLHWTLINDNEDSVAAGWRPFTVIPCKKRFWL
jgi:hypothetical protein